MINFPKLIELKQPHIKNYSILPIILLLSACDNSIKLSELCKDNTEICKDFGNDSWCKSERRQISLERIYVKNKDLDIDKYNLLIAYEGYIKCMELASQIQHIKLKEKTTHRKNNLIKAKGYLSLLAEKNIDSKHPHLLFYYWSRESNSQALADFLKLEGSPELENSIAQFHLATYYIKRDNKKTMGLLYHALELHEPGTILIDEILQTLATMHTKEKRYKHAYIWLRAYQLTQKKNNNNLTEISLNSFHKESGLERDFLDDIANDTLTKIKNGEFVSPKF